MSANCRFLHHNIALIYHLPCSSSSPDFCHPTPLFQALFTSPIMHIPTKLPQILLLSSAEEFRMILSCLSSHYWHCNLKQTSEAKPSIITLPLLFLASHSFHCRQFFNLLCELQTLAIFLYFLCIFFFLSYFLPNLSSSTSLKKAFSNSPNTDLSVSCITELEVLLSIFSTCFYNCILFSIIIVYVWFPLTTPCF